MKVIRKIFSSERGAISNTFKYSVKAASVPVNQVQISFIDFRSQEIGKELHHKDNSKVFLTKPQTPKGAKGGGHDGEHIGGNHRE